MAASLVSVVLFFVYTWGLGFSLTRLVKENESFLERNLMRLGFGLSAFVVLGIVLNALHIPLDYRIFLAASLAVPLYCLIFKKGHTLIFPSPARLKLTASSLNMLVVLLIFLASLFMYSSGAFRYPYLEDDDPWGHAAAAKYVSLEKTVLRAQYHGFQYMDPYPPGYDMIFGVLAQTASSVYWTLKFFNALMIALSLAFFYFFAKEFLGSRNKALFATFVLASVPAYLSHFIWAPALAMAVFPQTMYALEMIKRDRKWLFIAAVGIASILLAHPTHAFKLSALIAIYLAVRILSAIVSDRKGWLRQNIPHLQAVALGAALSLFWWALKWKAFAGMAKGGFSGGPEAAAAAIKNAPNAIAKILALITRAFNPLSGTASRAYSLKDFVVAPSANMINNPIGLGVAVSLLALAGIASAVATFSRLLPKPAFSVPAAVLASFGLTAAALGISGLQIVLSLILSAFALSILAIVLKGLRNSGQQDDQAGQLLPRLAVVLGWLLFTFLGINNQTFNLPVGLFAFRFWMILAIPVSIIAAEGFFAALNSVNLLRLGKASATTVKVLLIAIVVAGVLFTSAKQKYDVNTACWPWGAFWSGELVLDQESGCVTQSEVITFSWLTTLPPGTKVFTFSNPDQVIGYDKFTCAWCRPEYEMKKRFQNVTAEELHSFMGENDYDYFIIGGIDAKTYDLNSTLRLIDSVASSGLFTVAHQGQAAIIFRLA